MKRVLIALAFGFLALSASAANNGWHSGKACYESWRDAAVEYCGAWKGGGACIRPNIWVAGATNSCVAADPAAVEFCSMAFQVAGMTSSGVFSYQIPVMGLMSCSTDDNPGLTATKVADYMEMWSLFLLAFVLILGAKSIYNRFRISYDH